MASPLFAIRKRQSKIEIHRGHSSVGRAPALQAGSQGFESPCLQSTLAAVAESIDCRAVALARADLFDLIDTNAASYDSASQGPTQMTPSQIKTDTKGPI